MASPEASALAHIWEIYSIAPKSGASCQAFPGFTSLLGNYLINDLCHIVSDYACNPLTITLSVEKMMDRLFDPHVFRITGCDYVSITWYSGVSVTVNFSELSVILVRLYDVFRSRDGLNILSSMFQHELTLCFFGNITAININGCLNLTKVLEFPALSCLTSMSFMGSINLTQVPVELPSTVLSLFCCFANIPKPNGFQDWDLSNVINLEDAFKGYRGAKSPRWILSEAVSIRGIFDDARNIHPHGLSLYLPKCIDARRAFFQTTNLRGPVVVFAPMLTEADEMFDRQKDLKGNIFLIVPPKFLIHRDFACGFYSNNVDRNQMIEDIQAGREPSINHVQPHVISTEDVASLNPEHMFGVLSQTNFVSDKVECFLTKSPQLTPKIVREKNRFGRMANRVYNPPQSEVDRRKGQRGILVSANLLKHPKEPCEADVALLVSKAIEKAFNELYAINSWLYYKL